MLLVLRTSSSSAAGPLWLSTAFLLVTGCHRLLGTVTVFDWESGIVIVSRTLGRMAVFRQRFCMDSVVRVFNDRRSYIKPKIQNPKIQLLSGKQVNLSQWCPVEFDFEAETYTANRLLRAWRQAHPSEKGKTVEMYVATLGNASPSQWTIRDLEA